MRAMQPSRWKQTSHGSPRSMQEEEPFHHQVRSTHGYRWPQIAKHGSRSLKAQLHWHWHKNRMPESYITGTNTSATSTRLPNQNHHRSFPSTSRNKHTFAINVGKLYQPPEAGTSTCESNTDRHHKLGVMSTVPYVQLATETTTL